MLHCRNTYCRPVCHSGWLFFLFRVEFSLCQSLNPGFHCKGPCFVVFLNSLGIFWKRKISLIFETQNILLDPRRPSSLEEPALQCGKVIWQEHCSLKFTQTGIFTNNFPAFIFWNYSVSAFCSLDIDKDGRQWWSLELLRIFFLIFSMWSTSICPSVPVFNCYDDPRWGCLYYKPLKLKTHIAYIKINQFALPIRKMSKI